MFTAFALLLVVGIAQLMALAGVSMALGAFLAGVLLASSEYRHALETDIEPFKGLLMGLFFISVGMSIDFGLLAQRPWLVAALVLGFVALKSLSLAALASRSRSAARQRWLFAALLGAGWRVRVRRVRRRAHGASAARRLGRAAHAGRRAVDGDDAAVSAGSRLASPHAARRRRASPTTRSNPTARR